MKNTLPILLSIIVGIALSLLCLNTFLKPTTKKNISPKTKKIKEIKEIKGVKKTINVKNEAINTDVMQNSYSNWKAYMKGNIDLMATFTPIDNQGEEITKDLFLTLLRTGNYVVIKSDKEGLFQYELTEIKKPVNQKIKKAMISKAGMAHQYFKMEGQKLPNYDFVDLEGKSHNKEVRTGKITVLKSWFINCKVCVEEFPQLNTLVDTYKSDDVQFISLAFNEKEKLKKFLKTKSFKYVTVPDQKKYLSKHLKVKQYPTHIIINSEGVIIKMVNNVNTLTTELERILE
ncbi:TlpA disulfide reductase family protein [Tenacibaculum finnmarkense]|uniref:TlpA family protein disulfide reductase n=1 Tax=Tenacibaculum finnmarkense TaxID=2781243 RepID=UPI001E2D1C0A|nr:TlpA disulfide reductase family protein [Tenacibaculum finnmarkense]MCD8421916.1 TlpA family protein disulfide reductase [Tenacibaculum finnmarkense genomovar ulcerans]MCD8431422.1 TlpA family protein disulfide reductase [Tenacibaculum finnmarkense genomovar ulcerans]MCG8238043.1 TlpA family protein disulfide reductase [Tenacibaculum finnmarkense genomovar ulcerans]MCG8732744.1 TlpA family protein disulfide reductase [Tenacibaculum finnmarkense]MCG8748492.1 TlpA family protein disulfide red